MNKDLMWFCGTLLSGKLCCYFTNCVIRHRKKCLTTITCTMSHNGPVFVASSTERYFASIKGEWGEPSVRKPAVPLPAKTIQSDKVCTFHRPSENHQKDEASMARKSGTERPGTICAEECDEMCVNGHDPMSTAVWYWATTAWYPMLGEARANP